MVNGELIELSSNHVAPIPLYKLVVQGDSEKENPKVKLKFRRNPAQASSPLYEMEYHQFDGKTTESYCCFLTQWEEISKQIPLTTATQKFAQFRGLITGQALDNWDSTIAQLNILHPTEMQSEEGFNMAIKDFGRAYMSSDAKTKQRRFMNRHLSLPKTMTVREFYFRIQTMWRYFPLLLGDYQPRDDQRAKREFFVNCMPKWTELAMQRASYNWAASTINDMALIEYLQVLIDNPPSEVVNFNKKKRSLANEKGNPK